MASGMRGAAAAAGGWIDWGVCVCVCVEGVFGHCHGCVMLVLVWQATSGKNLRRIDGMCVQNSRHYRG